jgi:DNA-binding winged helix-turn-helix (wHTH) protein/Tol biopolymer transport system component
LAATGSTQVSDRNFRFGPFELSEREGELRKNGARIKLQEQPFQVLVELVANAGRVVTREELQQRLWPEDTFVDFNVGVNTAIRKLRLALNDDADKPRYIETLSKRGYRFIAEVTVQESITFPLTPRKAPPAEVDSPPSGREPVGEPTRGTAVAEVAQPDKAGAPENVALETRRRSRRNAILAVAASALIAAGALIYYYAVRPYPIPTVKEYKQLTFDGGLKFVLGVDGARIYLMLVTPEYTGMAELSTTGGELRKVPLLPSHEAFPLQISSDGTQLLVVDPRPPGDAPPSHFYSVPILGGAPRRLGDIKGLSASWSSDRSLLAYNTIDTIYLANGDGFGSRKLVTIPHPGLLFTWGLSPDGRLIRFSRRSAPGQPVRVWEINSDGNGLHQLLPGFTSGNDGEWVGGWSPDAHYFFFNCKDQVCVLPEKRTLLTPKSNPSQLTSGPTLLGGNALFSPDNRMMYAIGASFRGELERYDLETGLSTPVLGGGLSAEYVAFSPDRQWVAYVTYPQGALWRSRADGTQRLQLTVPPGYVIVPRWSADSKTIYYQTDVDLQEKLFQVSVDGGEPKPILAEDKGHLSDPNPSPDGRKLALSRCEDSSCNPNPNDSIEILDLDTGKASVVPGSQDKFFSVRWSPDGQSLASMPVDSNKLYLYNLKTKQWAEVDSGNHLSWQVFSHDGRFLYYMDYGLNPILCRLRVSDRHIDRFPLKNFSGTGHWGLALSLGPDDMPLLLRDKATYDLYALELEWK